MANICVYGSHNIEKHFSCWQPTTGKFQWFGQQFTPVSKKQHCYLGDNEWKLPLSQITLHIKNEYYLPVTGS